jgi:hypothetical protein
MVVTLLALVLTAPALALANDAQSTSIPNVDTPRPPEPAPEAQFPQERCVVVDVEVPSLESITAAPETSARSAP